MLALRPNPAKQQTSAPVTIPAPVGGLNARDSLAAMPVQDAITLTNFFPRPNDVELRKGYNEHSTGMGSAVTSLMTYSGTDGADVIIAGAGTTLWNATDFGTAATALGTGYTSVKWQYENMSTSAGHFLVAVNGFDTPIKYDGSAISTTTFTGSGLTATNLINIVSHKERLWFIEKNTMNLWYAGTQSISGAVSKFPVGSVFTRGGYAQAMGTISGDAGDGMDDYFAVISSSGEMIVYQGTDPSSANTWAKVGVYRIGEPIGDRAVFDLGGDLIILTKSGAVSAKKMMSLDESQTEFAALTYKINDLFREASVTYGNNFGWEGLTYPTGNWVLVNIPRVEESAQFQYVMNSLTGAWCKFSGLNANCWTVANEKIYFGGNAGKVYQADNGRQDDGGQIEGVGLTAFSDFAAAGRTKQFTMVRPFFYSNGTVGFFVGINVDYNKSDPTGVVSATSTTAGLWDTGTWDTAVWSGEDFLFRPWKGAGKVGSVGAVAFKVGANGQSCQINAFDVVIQPGGVL